MVGKTGRDREIGGSGRDRRERKGGEREGRKTKGYTG